ncbi:hypothetical protein IAD21_04522 [Abditibacteriota bacterium]|nr:hypothetical protein IAD21_04522 [Abditibacteriota bacterium]
MALSATILGIQRKALEQKRDQLAAQYAAAFQDELEERDRATKVIISAKIERLGNDLQRTEDELAQLLSTPVAQPTVVIPAVTATASTPSVSNQRHLQFQQYLLEIDFTDVRQTLDDVLRCFESGDGEGGAIVFVAKESYRLCGDLCLNIVREKLKLVDPTLNPRTIKFRFGMDVGNMLEELSRLFGVEPVRTDLIAWTQELVRRISSSSDGGGMVLIELKSCNYLEPQQHVLQWFFANIWQPLVDARSQKLASAVSVTFIVVMTWDTDVAPTCLPSELCCFDIGRFQNGHILQLPLNHWTESDIRKWLNRYDRILRETGGLKPQARDRLVTLIYDVSQGEPLTTHSYLKEQYSL